MTPDGGFGKREHILKSKDFKLVYTRGSRSRLGAVTLYCLANQLGHSRIGFSIGSRNVKRAVRRNRIRRVFREVYRKAREELKKSADIVLVVKGDFDGRISYDKLEKAFLSLARSARLI